MRLLTSQRDALLTTFCLLAMLAFLPFHGKNHKNSRSFGKEHKNSRLFLQKPQKFAFISAKTFQCLKNLVSGLQKCVCERLVWRDFGESADAHCFPEAFSGKVRVHFARLVRFWGKCACAFCFIAARCAAYDFLFARTARIFAVSRQKTQKFAARFWGKCVCARGSTARFGGKCAFIMAIGAKIIRKGAFKERLKFASKCERKL